MELLVALLLAAVFIGPTVYRFYEQYKRRKEGKTPSEPKKGRSYGRHLLGMLTPVFILAVFLLLLSLGLYLLAGR